MNPWPWVVVMMLVCVSHDWFISPYTEGKVKHCSKCGAYERIFGK